MAQSKFFLQNLNILSRTNSETVQRLDFEPKKFSILYTFKKGPIEKNPDKEPPAIIYIFGSVGPLVQSGCMESCLAAQKRLL